MGRLCQQRPSWTRTPINAKVSENPLTLSSVVMQSHSVLSKLRFWYEISVWKTSVENEGTLISALWGVVLFLYFPFSCTFLHSLLISAQRFFFFTMGWNVCQQTVWHQIKTNYWDEPPNVLLHKVHVFSTESCVSMW